MVVAWAQTNADLDGFGINRPQGSVPDGIQTAPAIADNTGEFFAVAWLEGSGPAQTVRARFYDSLGNPDPLLPGPVDLNDGSGAIVAGPVVAGWVEGYTVAWQERASEGEPALYHARLVGPEGLVGEEFVLPTAVGPNETLLTQEGLVLAGWSQIPDPVAGTEVVGFNAVWVATVRLEGGAVVERVMLQRYQVPLDALGNPQPAVAAGLDGLADVNGDAPEVLGEGTGVAMASLHDGEQVVAWIGADNAVKARFFAPDGGPLLNPDGNPVEVPAFGTVDAGMGAVRVGSFGVGNFGIFWVASEGGSLVIKGQIWGLPDAATAWGPLDPANPTKTIATLPPDFDGRFSVAGFGEDSDAGIVTYGTAGGMLFAQAFDPVATPTGEAFTIGTPGAAGAEKLGGGMAGLIGERAVVVWQDSQDGTDGHDIVVQIVDTREPGVTLVGDRDRTEINGRVDARRDILVGTTGDDLIVTDRGDTRNGRQADDEAHGVLGNDTLYGGGGNDHLDGGQEVLGDAGPEAATDRDTAAYRGARTDYSITVNGDGSFTVKDMRPFGRDPIGPDGLDTIMGFEELAFGSAINGPTLTVGADRVGMDLFFQARPGVPADADGTPQPWGLESTAPFTVNVGPVDAGPADLTAGVQTHPMAVGLLGGFAFAWQSGDAIYVRPFDALGQPDAAFGGGAAAQAFRLDDGSGSIHAPVAAMAGDAGVVAAWVEGEGAAAVITGRFLSSLRGVVGTEFHATEGDGPQSDAAVIGYEVVDAANDTAEYGFFLGYAEKAETGPYGRLLLERMTLYVRPEDGAIDPALGGERQPQSVGLDGRILLDGENGQTNDPLVTQLSATGRSLSLTTLHDGEVVASWVEPGANGAENVEIRVLAPTFGADEYTAFAEVTEAKAPRLAVSGIDAGTAVRVVGLGFNFAVTYLDDGVFKAQLYTGQGGAWIKGTTVEFDAVPTGDTGTIGEVALVATDLDGTAFTMFVEVTSGTGPDAVTSIHAQHFDGAGKVLGAPFQVFGTVGSLAPGGFAAAPLDDGRLVLAARGDAGDGADPDGIIGAMLDTRTPGEVIIGPRDGAPRDLLVGTTGDDVIDGRVLEDELHGGLGRDLVLGGTENDTLFGESGNDTLLGGSEDDSLLGGAGDDLLLGGFGVDTLDGGEGSDTVSMQGEFARFRVDLAAQVVQSDRDPALGTVRAGFATEDTLVSVENATGGEADDTLIGDAGDNILQGGGGNDRIIGGEGTDTAVFRADRSDYVIGQAPDGTVLVTLRGYGPEGTDRVSGVEVFRFADGDYSLVQLLAANLLTGKAVDGYISGATVFWDADGDRQQDAGEAAAVTTYAGGFSLTGPGGALVLRGGVDIATLLENPFVLEAPDAATVITPLTTLAVRYAALSGDDPAEARDAILRGLGLPAALDLFGLDPVRGVLDGVAGARDLVLAGTQVVDTLSLVQAARAAAGLAEIDLFGALAGHLAGLPAGTAFDLAVADDLADFLHDIGIGTAQAAVLSRIIAAGNALAAQRLDMAATAREALTELAAASIVARQEAAAAIEAAGNNPAALAALEADFTGAALAGRVTGALALVGDVDGDGQIDGSSLALTGTSVAENAAGAVIGSLRIAAPAGTGVTWEVLDGGQPADRFVVDTLGGEAVLRLVPGLALDYEAVRSVPLTIRAMLDDGTVLTRDVTVTVLDRDDPVTASPGGVTAATLTEDLDVPAPPALPLLTAAGQFGFTDQDLGRAHGVTAAPAGAMLNGQAYAGGLPGTFAVTLAEAVALGTGTVGWTYTVDNAALQGLGEGDELALTWRVSVGSNAEFRASALPGLAQADQHIARLAGGNYVLVWTETRDGADFPSVYARVFAADGTPVTADVRVNLTEPQLGAQTPSVAALPGGGFVVVWRSDGDQGAGDSSFGIAGQVFSGNGARVGGEFAANIATTVGDQDAPQVVALAGDRFLVTWTSREEGIGFIPGPDGQPGQVVTGTHTLLQGQIFQAGPAGASPQIDPDSSEVAELRLTPLDPPAGAALLPSIDASRTLALADGGFATAWTWSLSDRVEVLFQAFDAAGLPVGPAVLANGVGDAIVSAQQFTALGAAALTDGGFALAWQRSDGQAVQIRAFAADGTARTDLLSLDGAPSAVQLTALSGGGFVVAWIDQANLQVHGQAFSAAGLAIGDRFAASAGGLSGPQQDLRIVAVADGGFVLAWAEQHGLDIDVFAQEFDAGGTASAPGYQLNLDTAGTQELPELVALAGGGFAATWISRAAGDAVVGRVIEPSGAGSGSQLITVTLRGVNDAPVAEDLVANPEPGAQLVEAGAGTAGSALLTGDLRAENVWSDADAGELGLLRVTQGAVPGGTLQALAFHPATGEAALRGTFGTLYLTAEGGYRYVLDNLDPDTQALRANQAVSETFAYRVANGPGAGDAATASLTIRILGTNDRPTATAETASIDLPGRPDLLTGASEASGSIADNVGDVDAGEAALLRLSRVVGSGGPATAFPGVIIGTYGTLSINGNGAWSYALNLADPDTRAIAIGSTVQDVFSYTVANGQGADNSATATITVAISLPGLFGTALDDLILGDAQENFIAGLGGNDTLRGFGAGDRLLGNEGNDSLDGGGGADTMEGGAGDDTYLVSDAGDVVLEESGHDLVRALVDVTLADGVEDLVLLGMAVAGTGNDLDNLIAGNAAANLLQGLGGNDTLDGAGGADTLAGGEGDDTYVVDDAGAVVTEAPGEGTDKVLTTLASHTLAAEVETLLFTGAGDFAGTGNALANRITGGSGQDILDGGAGADTLQGLGGNDTYIVDDAGDLVTEAAGGGTDTVRTALSSHTLAAEVENLVYTGAGSFAGTGNGGANLITGGVLNDTLEGAEGNDTLNGGAGIDRLVGGAGDDTYLVDSAADAVVEQAGGGIDTVLSTELAFSLSALEEVENLVLLGDANSVGTGNTKANRLTSGAGADALDGGAGADTMTGGGGDDTYTVDDAGDLVVEVAGGGNDRVNASVSHTLSAEVETLVLTGAASINGTGNDLANLIEGNAGANILSGLAGNDTLRGQGSNDTLLGGADDDSLDGGAGADSMAGGEGDDVYLVDNTGDVIQEAPGGGRDRVFASASYTLSAELESLRLTGGAAISGTGNELDNLIEGNGAGNQLSGGAGNDTLDGGAGADAMTGGAGNDTFVVDNAGDTVTEALNDGTDTIRTSLASYSLATSGNVENLVYTGIGGFAGTGNALANMLTSGDGNDTLDGGIGADTLSGGLGNDTYVVDHAGDAVIEDAGGGTDTIRTTLATYSLAALPAIETLVYTGAGSFAGTGNDGANSLAGGAGNDTLDGGIGADTLSGGLGNDTYLVDSILDVVVEGAAGGTDTVVTTLLTYFLGTQIENAAFAGTGNFAATGNTNANLLTGGSGNDTLNGAGGIDTMVGGLGDDTYVVDHASDVVTEAVNGGSDTIRTTLLSLSLAGLANVEHLVFIGTGSFSGIGNGAANSLAGDVGSDTLDGGAGADTMAGGAGNDIYLVDSSADLVVEADGGGLDTVRTTLGTYSLAAFANVETLVFTGTGAFNGTGNGAANSLAGGAGNDTLDGGAGADTLAGGAGNDTYLVDNALDTITESTGIDTVITTLLAYTLGTPLEHLAYTGSGNFAGTGNGSANRLTGGSGNDTLNGLAGNDTMVGGLGNDTYVVDSAADLVDEALGGGIDTIRTSLASLDLRTRAGVENLEYTGASAFSGIGTTADNAITSGIGNDTLDGGAGNDTLTGGGGNDTYLVDSTGDQVVEAPGGGTDTIRTTVGTYSLGALANVENLVFTGTGNFNGTGNAAANSLSGGAGNDTLDGGAGADIMAGGAGNDAYVVDNAGDVVTEAAAGGTDTVSTSLAAYTLSANVENLIFTGAGSFSGIGNTVNNQINGGSGNDTLNGGTGADTLSGGAGNDLYVVDNSNDLVLEGANGGTDTIQTTLGSFSLAGLSNLENLIFSGTGAFSGTGNGLANAITGGTGNDTLNGGGGADVLTGGAGNDTFRFQAGEAQGDVVVGFAGNGALAGDQLVFAGYGTAAQGASFTDLGGGSWRITSANGLTSETITLLGAPTVHSSDVIFV